MKFLIEGATFEHLEVELDAGESIYSETGCLLHMTPSIELTTNFQGGLGGIFKRAITGNSVALNHFTAKHRGQVSFSTRMPGRIVQMTLRPHVDLLVQRHSFLCAENTVHLDIETAFNLTGIFGGNGLFYNRLSGNGTAFISIDGETKEIEMNGQEILVHPGHLAAYESTVNVEMTRLKGFKNLFFGGDGFALLRLSGHGKVILHTLSVPHLAELLAEYQTRK
jgi:uncharacterized protein (TIGR00266 family)